MSYRVTAPYVTLKVKDATGSPVITGFYRGAVVPEGVDEASLKHHLDSGMVEEVGSKDAPKPAVRSGKSES